MTEPAELTEEELKEVEDRLQRVAQANGDDAFQQEAQEAILTYEKFQYRKISDDNPLVKRATACSRRINFLREMLQ